MTDTASARREDRAMLRTISVLAWPAICEELFRTIIQYADTAMVGRLGAEASAAVGLTNSITWLFGSVMNALGTAAIAIISRSIGAGKKEDAQIASVQVFYLSVIAGLALFLITEGLRYRIPVWMNGSDEILADATVYFTIICLPMVFRSLNVMYGAVLRGAGDMRHPMVINIFMSVLNVVLNFFLIYPTRIAEIGELSVAVVGAGMGVCGAAWATSISMTVGGLLMFFAAQRNPLVTMRGVSRKINKGMMGQLMRLGIPMILQRATACLGYVVFDSLIARLGTVPLAAHSIANKAEQLFYIAGYGVQAAAATLAGNSLGENDRKKFVRVSKLSCAFTIALMILSGSVMFVTAPYLMAIFTGDAEVIRLGSIVLRIIAFTEPFFGLQVIMEGLFNGIGDPKPAFLYSLIGMWGVRILSSSICILVLHQTLPVVWICMGADNVLKAVLFTQRFVRGKWKHRFA